MATAAQGGRFHLRGGFPSLNTRRCRATRSPLITHSSAKAASAICSKPVVGKNRCNEDVVQQASHWVTRCNEDVVQQAGCGASR